MLLFDIDHFKRINDAFGHAVGDEALKRQIALISARARRLDMLYRIGGEEFVLLLPATRYAGAVAEQLRALVAGTELLDVHRISISIGASELQRGESAASWIADADAAVCRAKQGGRNRVGVSTGIRLAPRVRLARR